MERGAGISDFRSEASGDHKVFRDKCGDGELRLELSEMTVTEARGQGVDMFV